jgi:catalase-peroxidase
MKNVFLISALLICGATSAQKTEKKSGECPMGHTAPTSNVKGTSNEDWWPNKLNLQVLRQNSGLSNPMDANFNYRKEFSSVDYFALKKDIQKVGTDLLIVRPGCKYIDLNHMTYLERNGLLEQHLKTL